MIEVVLPGPFRAAVFDMDGLLLDSETAWFRAECELMARYGGAFSDSDRAATIGRSIDDSIRNYGVRLGLPASKLPRLRTELVDLARASYATTSTQPGARELVEALRGRLPVAVASNTDRSLVEGALAGAGFGGSFDAIVTADDVTRPKPADVSEADLVLASLVAVRVA